MSIKGLDRAEVLVALYSHARVQGDGTLEARQAPLTLDEARQVLATSLNVDYLFGRVLKVNLAGDQLDTWHYNRDNGPTTAEDVIAALRALQKRTN